MSDSNMSQLDLGVQLAREGKLEEAKEVWQSIQREDSSETFAKAQLNLGLLFDKQGKLEEAKEVWQSIQREDSAEQFAKAQFSLGLLLELQGKFIEASEAYELVEKKFLPELFYKMKIKLSIFSLIGKYNKNFIKPLLDIYKGIDSILSELKINHEEEINVAHYTRPFIGDLLLKKENLSKFRLSTIQGVNDPEEGSILSKFLKYDFEENNLLTFISCFTFNHDSLNQFRLYGKENGEESSGISLVFNRGKFFDQRLDLYKGIQNLIPLSEDDLSKENISDKIAKLPLYRCIYLESFDDKESYYLHVAHREELTFYRENNETKPDERWQDYQISIKKIEQEVKDKLNDIVEEIKKLDLNNKEISKLLGNILLPLRYLIKHSAFREEQECRIMYITDICDSKIKTQLEQNQIYVEYEPSVEEAIHKIYLSSGASKYRDHFRKLLQDKDGKRVINSKNPFRVKI